MIEKVTSIMSKIYKPAAIYQRDSDCVEYVQLDGGVYYDRVDNFLTLIKSLEDKSTVGFKLKGFKYILQNHSEELCLTDKEFSIVMTVFEIVFTEFGDSLFESPEIQEAYDEAVRLAANDNVYLDASIFEDFVKAA